MSVSKFKIARSALLAVLGMGLAGATEASAADLGGNCCVDLEERIAELEATTARKGNRKVSLEISGHINEALLWWDDGTESNAGVYTNDDARSRFRFKGEAKINDELKAGYLMEWGVRTNNSKRFNQNDPNGDGANALDLRHNYWYLNSKSLGRLTMGHTGNASEGITELNLAATKDIAKYSDQEDMALGLNMIVDGSSSGLSWRRLLRDGGDQPGEGRRHPLVKYDTPELAGFVATASWGEDDTWGIGLRYSGEISGFKIGAGIAYGENSDASTVNPGFQCTGNNSPTSDTDCEQLGGSVSVMHVESGLYVNFGAGYMKDNVISNDGGIPAGIRAAGLVDDRYTFYAGEVGIEKKFNDLGKTTIFGQYYKYNGGTVDRAFNAPVGVDGDVVTSEIESFGFGVVQGIDAAAMHLYLTYRHYTGDVTHGTSAAAIQTDNLDDLDVVMGGAIIRF